MNRFARLALAGTLMLGLPAAADAGGFANTDLSASSAGLANAFTATANDASAMSFNPSGIAWQDGVSVMAGGSLLRARNASLKVGPTEYPDTGGMRSSGQAYVTYMPHDHNLGFGLAYVTAYDADNNWSYMGGNFGVTDVNVQRVSADAIYAVSSSLALSVGVDWYYGKLALSQGAVRFDGRSKGTDFGGHASLMWRPWYGWSFGLMGRSGAKVKFDGDGGTSSLQLPAEFTAGVAHDFTDHIRLEIDGDWTNWSSLHNLNVIGGTGAQTQTLDLRNAISGMAGLTWTWTQNATFRFGYAYDGAASKGASFNPAMADQNGQRLSLGMGFDAFGFHTDASYSYTFYPNKSVSGSLVSAGTYRDRRQALLVSFSKVF